MGPRGSNIGKVVTVVAAAGLIYTMVVSEASGQNAEKAAILGSQLEAYQEMVNSGSDPGTLTTDVAVGINDLFHNEVAAMIIWQRLEDHGHSKPTPQAQQEYPLT